MGDEEGAATKRPLDDDATEQPAAKKVKSEGRFDYLAPLVAKSSGWHARTLLVLSPKVLLARAELSKVQHQVVELLRKALDKPPGRNPPLLCLFVGERCP